MSLSSIDGISSSALAQTAVLSCAGMRRAEQKAAGAGAGPGPELGMIVSLDDMMQRAGRAVAEAVRARCAPCRVLVLCGPGNNGGDGFVVADALRAAGWDVRVAALPAARLSDEATRARAAWGTAIDSLEGLSFQETDLVIDALFGTGLQRPLGADLAALFADLAARGLPVVAVDIPSGVAGDTGAVLGAAPVCQLTVTFFKKKRGHVLLPGAPLCGEVVVADIGIPGSVLTEADKRTVENDPALWRAAFPWPAAGQNKYSRGHALIRGGVSMTGATRLAARAAQRMGAGLVTLAAPDKAFALYSASLASVVVQAVDDLAVWKDLAADPKRQGILIGPGLGRDPADQAFVLAALAVRKATVLDADALTLFADDHETLFKALHEACVLTPHAGEFARLFPDLAADRGMGKVDQARAAASRAGCVVLLKGADTVVAAPSGLAIVNTNAPPWLATGGAGDVLAGLVLGLLTSGMPPCAAAACAAFVHGAVAAAFGPGLIAEDLVAGLSAFLKNEWKDKTKTRFP